MKLTLATAAIAAMVALTVPAHAQQQMDGMDFNNQCEAGISNPFCYGYVTGFFYALEADGKLCPSGVPDNRQMVMVVGRWLRSHNSGPPKFNVRDALVNAWGCRR